MARKTKRNAQEAFEPGTEVAEHEVKRQKKQKSKKHRRESGDHDDAAAQLQRESEDALATAATTEVVDTAEQAVQDLGTGKKRKRKSKAADSEKPERKSNINSDTQEQTTAPESKSERTADHTSQSGTHTADKPAKNKLKKLEKRQRRLEAKAAAAESAEVLQVPEASEVTGSATLASPLAEDHSDEALPKRRRKKSKKRSVKERESAAGLGARIERREDVDPADVVDEASEERSHTSDEREGGSKLVQTRSLEDRIEAPPSPKRRRKSKLRTPMPKSEGWSLSDGTAGCFIGQDPLMTDDDQHLILPTRSEIRIYSTSTSLLVRSLPVGYRTVVSVVISRTNSARLVVGTNDGTISIWDWTRGRLLQEWRSPNGLQAVISMSPRGPDDAELVLALHEAFEDRRLAVYALQSTSKEATSKQLLLTRTGLNSDIQLFEEAGVIVGSAFGRLIIGVSSGFQVSTYEKSAITWREFSLPDNATAVDCRIFEVKGKPPRKRLDVVVGLRNGSIVLYEDLLYRIIGKEKKKTDDPITARFLNWHRGPVNTVKWSRDGNYVISGGNETVLVIWQLDTNKQQYLPHLSTNILRLYVSKKGSAYALQLGDNSVMVLSTADLVPTANISLLAATSRTIGSVVAAIDPIQQGHLVAAVPTSSLRAGQASILQTYDYLSDMQIAHQALTRNLTTTVNIGPDGQQIKEPNVSHLAISFDGRWLATVEQWQAPPQDLEGVLLADDKESRSRRIESTLRFWGRNDDQHDWELVNRVDQPHESNRVLSLAQHPSRVEFATAASDGTIHYWTPKARKRDGVSVRNQKGQQLYNWSVTRSVAGDSNSKRSVAALSYSQDGTILAASFVSPAGPQWTYLIEDGAQTTAHYTSGLFTSEASQITTAFVDQYLITLASDGLTVYDTIESAIVKSLTLGGDQSLRNKSMQHHLAANILDGTFALGLNSAEDFLPGRVLVFNLRDDFDASDLAASNHDGDLTSGLLFEDTLNGHITSLLASASSPGYVVIDSNAEIRQIRGARPGINNRKVGAGFHKGEAFRGLDAIFGHPNTSEAVQNNTPAQLEAAHEDDMQVDQPAATTQGKTLEDLLGFQSSMQVPSVGDLFERVVGLFRRPQGEQGAQQGQQELQPAVVTA